MTAPLKAIDGTDDLAALMHDIGRRAKAAARVLAQAPAEQKNRALAAIAKALRADATAIIAANAEDVAEARANDISAAFLDRLTLDAKRVESMAAAIDTIRDIPDPVGQVTERWTRPNGMTIERVRVPLGVVGVIFESRPNVAADAGALCLKAGNAVILRGGSDSFRSCRAIHASITRALREANLPEDAIMLVPTRDRAAVGQMLAGLDGAIDVIVPRGGKSLVARVQDEARVPVFAHLEGMCHVYVDGAADLDMAKNIVVNAKMRRTGVCGAAETLLVDRAAEKTHLQAAGRGADRRGLRSARRRGNAGGGRARENLRPKRTGSPNISTRSSPRKSSTASMRRSTTSSTTAPTTPTRSSPTMQRPRSASSTRSTRRSCCTTPRRNSPTAASSASAARSASPPANSMRAGRSAPSSSRASSTACWDQARPVRDIASADFVSKHFGRTSRRPARRFVQSAACGASRAQPVCAEATATRPGVVAGLARQSAEGHARPARARCAPCRRARDCRASRDRCHRHRGGAQHALHCRHDRGPAPQISERAIRLADGRRQPFAVPPLARLGASLPGKSRSR